MRTTAVVFVMALCACSAGSHEPTTPTGDRTTPASPDDAERSPEETTSPSSTDTEEEEPAFTVTFVLPDGEERVVAVNLYEESADVGNVMSNANLEDESLQIRFLATMDGETGESRYAIESISGVASGEAGQWVLHVNGEARSWNEWHGTTVSVTDELLWRYMPAE